MIVKVAPDRKTMGQWAADHAAVSLRRTICELGTARLVGCTGSSQFEVLDAFTAHNDVNWTRIELFHLDEYLGIAENHPASFRRFLRERLISKTGITKYHLLDENNWRGIGELLAARQPDVAFVGIGENGHLAFNDPPADFDTEDPYILVALDEACRRQQVGEGWYASIDDVPKQAISMSVRQILESREIICSCPDARKAAAVKACFDGPISNMAPASILRTHPNVTVYLDQESNRR